ncbi:homoserine kinase [Saccharothrix coeruleofusca]|uniref:Homoserine kinase n=1 Tax=Saccharothrix coeruleofusca TaxID=33919 RepID=A0A918AJS8_9PSEU|nr:homoserine kinase [Saccharothrix coeruleofusca]MBP2338787.1 homoserine kinase [Saccharothrix coeruleofusca]GGP45956.1 homoserine kinase [Saccharothrix coeruleofusca]
MTGVRVTVPASTANLGSGFDALGMALGLHDVVEFEVVEEGLVVEVSGDYTDVPTGEDHLVVRAFRAGCELLDVKVPGLVLRCRNTIPHARGLGSSSAAVVAGVAAAFALGGREPDTSALQLAAEFEGHADNAAACMFGGVAIAWSKERRFRSVRVDPHPDVSPVVLVPEQESSTRTTRGLLPARVPHEDAAFAAGRSALAVHALTRDPSLLLDALDDRLHEPYREPAWPATTRLVAALRAAGVPAAVSGAGPTALALPPGGVLPEEVDTSGFAVRPVPVDLDGARVAPLG